MDTAKRIHALVLQVFLDLTANVVMAHIGKITYVINAHYKIVGNVIPMILALLVQMDINLTQLKPNVSKKHLMILFQAIPFYNFL